MRCILCERLSFTHICFSCEEKFLTPSLFKRKILDGIEVFSFYKYNDIKDLIHTKHTDLGYYVYSALAKLTFKKFSSEFVFDENTAGICIDDRVKNGYSHTAVLNKALKSRYITPRYAKLRSNNDITYSGKTKEYRLNNPRDFELKEFKEKNVILVDDIITTGLTLTQGCNALRDKGKEILFCLTLADAGE
ncbi:phosphoribosyltransferase family protein [Sulfurimonas sp. HSL-1716]|uniref:ComF family protein n=1 Tax=Hydrocurvibacter sulfurireducens TaxID=3131937 RepID=UPI0031F9EBBF